MLCPSTSVSFVGIILPMLYSHSFTSDDVSSQQLMASLFALQGLTDFISFSFPA